MPERKASLPPKPIKSPSKGTGKAQAYTGIGITQKDVEKVAGKKVDFNQYVAELVLVRLEMGHTLGNILEASGMPSYSTVLNWRRTHPKFGELYEAARREGAMFRVDTLNDDIKNAKLNSPGDIARLKMLVETNKWVATKYLPRVYGEKVTQEHTGPDGGPLQIQKTKGVSKKKILLAKKLIFNVGPGK